MESLTFQEQAGAIPLEQYEWTRIWFEDTYDQQAKRVAYIGDSICECTYSRANQLSGRKVLFNNYASSKAVDHPHYFSAIAMFLAENPKLDAIIINNGLHGFHLAEEAYKLHYQAALQKIKAAYPSVPVYIVLTTAISPKLDTCPRVPARNEMALQIAREESLPVIDLYHITVNAPQLWLPDGVHYIEEGYCTLAKAILESLDL